LGVLAGWSAVGGTPTMSAQSAPVSPGLTVNDPAIAPGDTLVAGITANNPAGGPLWGVPRPPRQRRPGSGNGDSVAAAEHEV